MSAIISGQGLGLFNTSLGLLGEAGQVGGASQGRSGEKVYVNAANGNLVVRQQDEWLVAAGPDVGLNRTYNSAAGDDGDNSDNWRLGFARSIAVAANGTDLVRIGEDGHRSTYVPTGTPNRWISKDGSGGYDIIDLVGSTLVWTDGSTQLKETYAFESGGFRLVTVTDADNKTLTLSYDGAGLITQIADSSGDLLKISYHAGTRNIKDISTETKATTDGTGPTTVTKRVSYTYTGANRLSTVTVDLTPDNTSDSSTYVTTYDYDANGRLSAIVQTDGSILAIGYHADGRVKTLTDWRGSAAASIATEFTYSGNETTVTTTGVAGTTATATRTYKLTYDTGTPQNTQQLRSLHVLDASSQYVQLAAYTYDTSGNLATATDARGKVTTYDYDSYGNRTYERDEQGNVVRRTFSGDGKNLLLSETVHTGLDPDGAGSLDATGGQTTRYVYDASNHLRFVVTAAGRVTEHTYNAAGAATSSGLRNATIEYDSLYSGTVGLSELAGWTPGKVRAQRADYLYDYRGQITKTTVYDALDASGNGVAATQSTVEYVYDPSGNLRWSIDGRGKTRVYTYDGLNRVTFSQDGEGNPVYTVHADSMSGGPATAMYMANGRVSLQMYDTGGLLVATQESDASGVRLQSSYTYDKLGNLRRVTANGQSTHYIYDTAGRKVGEVSPGLALTIYVYNGNGQLTASIRRANAVGAGAFAGDLGLLTLASVDPGANAADRYSFNAYDKAGRLSRTVDASGAVVAYSYDGAGRLVGTTAYAERVDAALKLATLKNYAQFYAQYGWAAEMIETLDPIVVTPEAKPAEDRVTRQFYDADGNLLATLDAEGTLTESSYDGAGRIKQTRRYAQATPANLRATGTLDALRPTAPDTADELSIFFYDAKGQLAGSYAAFGYDSTPNSAGYRGYLTAFAYDKSGNRIAEVRYAQEVKYTAGKTLAQLLPVEQQPETDLLAQQTQKTYYDYDGNNRVKLVFKFTRGQELQGLDNGTTTYTYDAAGNLTETVLASGVAGEQRKTRRRYDALGRVTHELGGVGVEKLALAADDAAREVVWNTYGTRYTYNADGRLVSSLSPNGSNGDGNRTIFYYNNDGRLTHSINALGEVAQYAYNTFGERISEKHYAGRIAWATLITLNGGKSSDAALIGALGSSGLTSQAGQDSELLTSYTERGEVYQTADALGNVNKRTYTAFGQLLQREDRVDAGYASKTTYSYTRVGLRQFQIEDDGGASARSTVRLYDSFGRLQSENDGRGVPTAYAYDRLGRVVTVTDRTAIERKTTYDAFSRVLKTVDGTGQETVYTYDAVKREMRVTTPEGVESITETNRHGETVKVTIKQQPSDPLARVTVYAYDADGRVLSVTNAQGTGAQSTVSTEYDKAGRAWKVTDARNVVTQFSYDVANRVLTRTVDPGTGTELNLETKYYYDGKGQATWTRDPAGTWTWTQYDKKGQVVAVTVDAGDPDVANSPGLKLRTEYTYDARGNTLTVAQGVNPDAGLATNPVRYAEAQITRYVYDGLGRRLQEIVDPKRSPLLALSDPDDRTAALNLTTTYVYDGNDNVVSRVDPLGKITRYVYDAADRQTFAIAATGAVTQTDYDREGRATRVTAYANKISLAGLGYAVSRTEVKGRIVDSGADQTVRRAYDKDGRLRYAADARNYLTEFGYDAAGNTVKTTRYYLPNASIVRDATPVGVSEDYVSFTVSGIQADSANDRVEQTVYDAANRAVYSIDALKGVTQRRYDAAGNVIEVRRYLATMTNTLSTNGTVSVSLNPGSDQITRTVYDKANRAIFTIDAENYVTQTGYDKAGRVIAQTRFAGTLQGSFTDNAALSVISLGDAIPSGSYVVRAVSSAANQDALTEHGYDTAGRLQYTKAASGATEVVTTGRAYDKASRLLAVYDSAGATEETTTLFGYDTAGRLVEETRDHNRAGAATTRYVLDQGGNRAQVISANGVALAESDDDWAKTMRKALGYVDSNKNALLAAALSTAQKTVLRTRYTTYQEFDEAGRITKVTDPFNGATTTQYDAFGNAVKITDPKGVSGYFYFDKRNQSVLHIDPRGFVVATEYDGFGSVDKIIRYVNPLEGAPVVGTLPEIRSSALAQPPVGGYVLTDPSFTSGDQTTHVKHDKLGRQTEIVDANGKIEKSSYDALGNRTTLTNKLDGVFIYTYDRLGRVKTETLPVWAIKRNLSTGAIERQGNGDPQTVAVLNEYTYDSRGNKTRLVEAQGLFEQRTTDYAYDRHNRLVKQTGEAVDVFSVDNGVQMQQRPVETRKYDTRGNLIEQVDPNGARILTFWDGLNRKTAELRATKFNADGSQAGTLTAYDYDDAGNVVAQRIYGTQVNLASAGGVRPTPPAGTDVHATAYVYDANNRLVETRVAGITVGQINAETGNYEIQTQDLVTRNEYDENGNLVVETDARGGKNYYYYDNVGNRAAKIDAERYLSAWAYDGAGHVLMEYRFGARVTPDVDLSPALDLDTLTFLPDEETRATAYNLDKLGRVLNQTVYYVDAAMVNESGQVAIEPANGNRTATTIFEYDALGNVTKKTEATGEVLDWTYDKQGRLVKELGAEFTDVNGSAVRLQKDTEYNALSLATRRLERLKDAPESAARVSTYTYDRNGLLASETDAGGAVKFYWHDAAGHQTRVLAPRYAEDALQGAGKLYVDRQNVGVGSWSELNGTGIFAWSNGLTYSSEVTLGEHSDSRNFMVGMQNLPSGPGYTVNLSTFNRHDAYFLGDELRVQGYNNGTDINQKMTRVPAQTPDPKLKPHATYVVEIKVLNNSGQYVSRLTVYEKGTNPVTDGAWVHEMAVGAVPWAQARIHSANQLSGGAFTRDAIDNIKVVNGTQVLVSENFDNLATVGNTFTIGNPSHDVRSYWVMDSQWQSLYSTRDVQETQYDLAGREVKRQSYSNAGGGAGRLFIDRRQTASADTWSQLNSTSTVAFTNGSAFSAEVSLGSNDSATRQFMLGLQNAPASSAGGAGFRRFDAYFVNGNLRYSIYNNSGQLEEGTIDPAGALKANTTYRVEIKLAVTGSVNTYQLRVYEKGQTTAVWSKDFAFSAAWSQHYVHAAALTNATLGGIGDSIDNLRVANGSTVAFSESFGSAAPSSLTFLGNGSNLLRVQGEAEVSTWETRYDAYGQVTGKGRNGGFQESAQYDAAGRLVRATGPDGVPKIFIADAQGNVTLTLKPPADGATPSDVITHFTGTAALTAQDFRTIMAAGGNATVSGYSKRNELTDTFETKADQLLASLNAVNLTLGGLAAQPFDIDPPAGVITAGQSVKVNYTLSSTFHSNWTGGGSGNDRTVETLNNKLHLEISKSGLAGTEYEVVLYVAAGHTHRHGKGFIQEALRTWRVADPTGSAPTVVDLNFDRYKTSDYRLDYGATYGAAYSLAIYKVTDPLTNQKTLVGSYGGEIPGPTLPPYLVITGWRFVNHRVGSVPIYQRVTSTTVSSGGNFQTPDPKELTITVLPGGTKKVYVQYRVKGQASGAWTTIAKPYNGTSLVFNEQFLKDIGPSAIPAGVETTLEFNFYSVDEDGRVISTQVAEVAVKRDNAAQPQYTYAGVPSGLKAVYEQSGRVQWTSGQLVYVPSVLAQNAPVPASATIRYRAVGAAWPNPLTSQPGNAFAVDALNQPAGWFQFGSPAYNSQGPNQYEYVIDFLDALGRVTSSVTGYVTSKVDGSRELSAISAYERRSSLMHFSNVPPAATQATLTYKVTTYTFNAQNEATAVVGAQQSATLSRGADGNFDWDLAQFALEPTKRYVVDFTFDAKNSGGQTVATLIGREGYSSLLAQPVYKANVYSANSASSQSFRISGPQLRLVHSADIGKVARKAYLYYRNAGSGSYNTLGPVSGIVNSNSEVEYFAFDLTSLLAANAEYLDLDIYYRYEDDAGNTVLGSTAPGALNTFSPTQAFPALLRLLPQKAYEVEAGNVNISMVGLASSATAAHRQQVYNAYGEVVQEYTPMALKRIRDREIALGRSLTPQERAAYGTTMRYDGAGRLVEKLEAQTSVVQSSGYVINDYRSSTKYVYDKQGRLIRQTDANGNETTFVLLNAGNGERKVRKEIDANGGVTAYAYDVFGDQRRKTVGVGTVDVVSDYAYDKLHRVVRVDQPAEAGNVRPTDLYFYDSLGNRVAHRSSPDAAANANGAYGTKDVRVYTERMYYDDQGRVVRTRTALGLETTTTYQVQGGLDYRKVVDENGKTSEEWLDYAGRVLRRINLGGKLYKNKYNLAGNLIEQIEVNNFADTVAKSGGQNIRFEYFGDGTLKKIQDVALGTVTNYGYDLNGNKTFEGYQNANGSTVYQSSNATYDELGRIKSITDTRYTVTYTYDKVGNRRSIVATQAGVSGSQSYWYSYDKLNRLLVSMGELDGGPAATDTGIDRVVKGSGKGVRLLYDLAGNRAEAQYASGSTEVYLYTKGGHLTEVRKNSTTGELLSTRTNDLLGRVKTYVEQRAANGPTPAYADTQNFTYDADGRVVKTISTSTKANSSTVTTDTYYTELPTVAVPQGGRMMGMQQWSRTESSSTSGGAPTISHTKYTYAYFDNAQQQEIRVDVTNADVKEKSWGRWADGISKFTYDVNGHVDYVGDSTDGTGNNLRNIAFINNAQGLILNRSETGPGVVTPSQSYFYFDGKRVAEWGNNPGIGSIDYSTALSTPPVDNPKDRYRNIGPITSNFDQNYQPINATYPSFVPGSYKARAGEDLPSIARAVWGDASMWYLIAEANGFTATPQLREGQLLVIPNKVTNFHNTSQTFKVYNPGEVMGDVSPTVPEAPLPPLPKLDGCGVIGAILMAVVAVVATVVTAGAALSVLAPQAFTAVTALAGTTTTLGGLVAAGTSVLGGGIAGVAGFAAAAIGGAVGSVASQLVGLATGTIDKFSWSGVAMGAIGSAVTAGVGAAAWEGLDGAGAFFSSNLLNGVAKAATGSAITQGIGVVAGLQKKFSWTGVAAAALGSAASYGATEGLKAAEINFGSPLGNQFGYGVAGGVASGAAQALVFRKRPNWGEIAAQAFSSVMGDAIVNAISDEDELNALAASGQAENAPAAAADPTSSSNPAVDGPAAVPDPSSPSVPAADEPEFTSDPTSPMPVVRKRASVSDPRSPIPAAAQSAIGDGVVIEADDGVLILSQDPRKAAMARVRAEAANFLKERRDAAVPYDTAFLDSSSLEQIAIRFGAVADGGIDVIKDFVNMLSDGLHEAKEFVGNGFQPTDAQKRKFGEIKKTISAAAETASLIASDPEGAKFVKDFARDYYYSSSSVDQTKLLAKLPTEILLGLGARAAGTNAAKLGIRGLDLLKDSAAAVRLLDALEDFVIAVKLTKVSVVADVVPVQGKGMASLLAQTGLGIDRMEKYFITLGIKVDRIASVTPDMAKRILARDNQMFRNPLTNKLEDLGGAEKMYGAAQVDHVVPLKRLLDKRLFPGVEKLTRDELKQLVQGEGKFAENLQMLPKSFNASKGGRQFFDTYKGAPVNTQYNSFQKARVVQLESMFRQQITSMTKGR